MIEVILAIVLFYALVGVVFAFFFVIRGASALDPSAKGGPWGFRVLIFPGSAALWPVLFSKIIRARKAGSGVA